VSAAGLKAKTIGATRATTSGHSLEKNRSDANLHLDDTQEYAYLDLASGRLDGILADAFVNYGWLESDAGKGFEFKGKPVFEYDFIGIAVRKGEDELRMKLNKAIKDIVANGTSAKLHSEVLPLLHLLIREKTGGVLRSAGFLFLT